MMIKNTTSIGSVESTTINKPQKEEAPARPPLDRVTTAEAQKTLALAQSLRTKVGLSHTAMLARVEAAIRSGTYSPSAGQLANKLLDAAEVDARIQAMMRA
jgi:anti-sigma28 factor (negative regulator of flagellin synthesis)